METTTFVIDTMPEYVFAGFSQSVTWNGWACPLFTLGEALKIVEAHKEQGLKAYYDPQSDIFAFEMAPLGDYETYSGVEVEGEKLYPVGAGCWIWEEHTDEAA